MERPAEQFKALAVRSGQVVGQAQAAYQNQVNEQTSEKLPNLYALSGRVDEANKQLYTLLVTVGHHCQRLIGRSFILSSPQPGDSAANTAPSPAQREMANAVSQLHYVINLLGAELSILEDL